MGGVYDKEGRGSADLTIHALLYGMIDGILRPGGHWCPHRADSRGGGARARGPGRGFRGGPRGGAGEDTRLFGATSRRRGRKLLAERCRSLQGGFLGFFIRPGKQVDV